MNSEIIEIIKGIDKNIQPSIIKNDGDVNTIFFTASVEYLDTKTNLKQYKSKLLVLNLKDNTISHLSTASRKSYTFLVLSQDRSFVATGYKSIKILSLGNEQKKINLETKHKQNINCAFFSEDKNLFLSGSGSSGSPVDYSVCISDLNTGKLLLKIKNKNAPIIETFLDKENNIHALDSLHNYYKWSMDGKLLFSQKPKVIVPDRIGMITFLFHGKILLEQKIIISTIEGFLYIWNLETGKILKKTSKYCKDAWINNKTINCIDYKGKGYSINLESFFQE